MLKYVSSLHILSAGRVLVPNTPWLKIILSSRMNPLPPFLRWNESFATRQAAAPSFFKGHGVYAEHHGDFGRHAGTQKEELRRRDKGRAQIHLRENCKAWPYSRRSLLLDMIDHRLKFSVSSMSIISRKKAWKKLILLVLLFTRWKCGAPRNMSCGETEADWCGSWSSVATSYSWSQNLWKLLWSQKWKTMEKHLCDLISTLGISVPCNKKNNMQKKQKTYNTQTKNAKPQQKNKKNIQKTTWKAIPFGHLFQRSNVDIWGRPFSATTAWSGIEMDRLLDAPVSLGLGSPIVSTYMQLCKNGGSKSMLAKLSPPKFQNQRLQRSGQARLRKQTGPKRASANKRTGWCGKSM